MTASHVLATAASNMSSTSSVQDLTPPENEAMDTDERAEVLRSSSSRERRFVRAIDAFLIILLLAACCAAVIFTLEPIDSTSNTPPPMTYVDIGGIFGGLRLSKQRELAVQVCAGLYNRDQAHRGAVYTFTTKRDLEWLLSTGNNDTVVTKATLTDPMDFLYECLQSRRAKGRLRYSWSDQKIIIPNIVTLAAVLDAVPLEDSDLQELNVTVTTTPILFDAVAHFPQSVTNDTKNAPRVATEFVFQHYANLTSGMAKMNPGLDVHGKNKVNPPLLYDPELGLVDYIVKEKLFNFFLNLGCVPMTDDHELMELIVTQNNWTRPLRVMGYDDTIAAAGDVFEAETDCVREHNMGQVASNGVSNLSFFSGKRRITKPLLQVPDPPSMQEPYNSNITYLSVLMGDGDNLNFVKESRRDWMEQRLAACAKGTCFPLVWTMSPAALYLAPDWLRWYYNQSYVTQNDWFVLPPSGDTYSYPSEMNSDDQEAFVAATEEDVRLMNSSGTVSWEFFSSWRGAISHFFPRFARNEIVKACFAVNVPYFFPIWAFGREYYKIIDSDDGGDGQVVLFAPCEWRGEDPNIVKPNALSPAAMAAEVNSYPPGTVSHIYATSDGGFDYKQLTEMVGNLSKHVRLVGANELALRAKQREPYLARLQDAGGAVTKEVM